MGLFSKLFSKKEIKSNQNKYEAFWQWFEANEDSMFKAIQNRDDIEANVLNKIEKALKNVKDGIFLLVGMNSDDVAEIIFTAEGNPQVIPIINKLISYAPSKNNWLFTPLKSAMLDDEFGLEMNGVKFDTKSLSFITHENEAYPDLIELSVVHKDLTKDNIDSLQNGVYIFLDNYLGELDFLHNVDNVHVVTKEEVTEADLIPITKMKDYLVWRQKEFVEKYQATRYETANDNHAMIEGTLSNGCPILAVINMDLLRWDSKTSHPWVCVLNVHYDGTNNNGMPNSRDYELMNEIEDEILNELKDVDGYLNIGRETGDGKRFIYFALKDYNHPALVIDSIMQKYQGSFEMELELYKDKYWQRFEQFTNM